MARKKVHWFWFRLRLRFLLFVLKLVPSHIPAQTVSIHRGFTIVLVLDILSLDQIIASHKSIRLVEALESETETETRLGGLLVVNIVFQLALLGCGTDNFRKS